MIFFKISKLSFMLLFVLSISFCGSCSLKNVEGELSPEELKNKLDDKKLKEIEKEAKVAGLFSELSLENARHLEKCRKYKEAVVVYKTLAMDSPSPDMVEAARMGLARSLLGMGNAAAAVSALMPLSDNPVTGYEKKSLALAGQAFLIMKDPVKAEAVIEVALSDMNLEIKQPKWTAPACANLAKAYIENDKPDKSARMFRYASAQYRSHNKLRSSAQCMRMYNKVVRMLQQARVDHTRFNK